MNTGDKIKKQASKWEKETIKTTGDAKAKIDKGVKKIKSKIDNNAAKGEKLKSQGKDILDKGKDILDTLKK